MWLGVRWNRKNYPKRRATLLPGDDRDAMAWVAKAARRRSLSIASTPDMSHEVLFTDRGVETYVGVHRAKRIAEF